MADPIDKPALRALVAHAYDMRLSERRGADILSVMRKLADACLALLDRNAELEAEKATLRGCVTNLRQQLAAAAEARVAELHVAAERYQHGTHAASGGLCIEAMHAGRCRDLTAALATPPSEGKDTA